MRPSSIYAIRCTCMDSHMCTRGSHGPELAQADKVKAVGRETISLSLLPSSACRSFSGHRSAQKIDRVNRSRFESARCFRLPVVAARSCLAAVSQVVVASTVQLRLFRLCIRRRAGLALFGLCSFDILLSQAPQDSFGLFILIQVCRLEAIRVTEV